MQDFGGFRIDGYRMASMAIEGHRHVAQLVFFISTNTYYAQIICNSFFCTFFQVQLSIVGFLYCSRLTVEKQPCYITSKDNEELTNE